MAQLARVNGTIQPGAFYGYQPIWVKVAGTGIGTQGIDGNWERAVRAVQTVAATVIIGTPTADAFMVVVDGNTANVGGVAGAILAATGITVTVTTATDLGTTLPA